MSVRFLVGCAVISMLAGCQASAPNTNASEAVTGIAASVKEQTTTAAGVSDGQTQAPSDAKAVESTSITPKGFWRVVRINNAAMNRPAKINFGAQKVTGEGPCNRYFANWSTGPQGLNLGSVVTTRMACAPDVMAEESQFVRVLEKVTRAYMQDGALIMTTPNGESLVMVPR